MNAFKLDRLLLLKSRLAAKPAHFIVDSTMMVNGHPQERREQMFVCAGFNQTFHHKQTTNGDLISITVNIRKFTDNRKW